MKMALPYLRGWILTAPMKHFIKRIPTGLLLMSMACLIKPMNCIYPASIARITMNIFLPSCRRLPHCITPEGFTDKQLERIGPATAICYCENCKKDFHDKTGNTIPAVKNWNDTVYRQWIHWNYNRRLEIWDLNNRITKAAGGPKLYMEWYEQRFHQRAGPS